MRGIAFLVIAVFILHACSNHSETTEVISKDSIPSNDTVISQEMKEYWMVLLKAGPNRNQDSASAVKIQERHIANIQKLSKEGKLIMAGPMGDNTDLIGIFVLKASDSLEAAELVKTDTTIITGRLRFELHPWWVMKGTYVFD